MTDGVTPLVVPDAKKTRASGVWGGALFDRRWMTRRARARVGQQKGSPLRPSLMTSLGMPFFWVVKVREAERAWRSSSSVAVSRLRRVGPTKSWTSPRVKGVVSDGESVYSPGRRR